MGPDVGEPCVPELWAPDCVDDWDPLLPVPDVEPDVGESVGPEPVLLDVDVGVEAELELERVDELLLVTVELLRVVEELRVELV